MINRKATSLTLAAFLFLGAVILLGASGFLNTPFFLNTSANDVRAEGKHLRAESAAVAERPTTGSHPAPASVVEQEEVKHASRIALFHFEPLMLLLLGSALFSVGTTIKLVVSRRLDKSVQRQVAGSRHSRSLAA